MRFAVALLVTFWIPAVAQSAGIDRVDVSGYGIAITSGTARIGTGTSGIPEYASNDVQIVTTTDIVPACIGMRFGIRYNVVGAPNGAPENITTTTRFPLPGLAMPGAAEPILVNRYVVSADIGRGGYHGYRFDEPWELVPGRWTLEIWSRDRLLASHSFMV